MLHINRNSSNFLDSINPFQYFFPEEKRLKSQNIPSKALMPINNDLYKCKQDSSIVIVTFTAQSFIIKFIKLHLRRVTWKTATSLEVVNVAFPDSLNGIMTSITTNTLVNRIADLSLFIIPNQRWFVPGRWMQVSYCDTRGSGSEHMWPRSRAPIMRHSSLHSDI